MNVLIVEDEPIIRQGIRVMVENAAPHLLIDEANNGLTALNMTKEKNYDIILMDINMPKLTGIELAKEISQNKVKQPCIIVISGFDDFSYAVEMMRYGAMEYLLKPVDRHKLKQALEKAQDTIVANQEQSLQDRDNLSLKLKYYLTEKLEQVDEIIIKSFDDFLQGRKYQIICTEEKLTDLEIETNVYGYNIYISFENYDQSTFHLSISDVHIGAENLKKAYEQATKRYLEKMNNNKNKIQEALRYIEKNYTKPLDMAVISNHVSMNYTLFSHLFKNQVGVNFSEYLRSIRIEAAKQLLQNTNKTIRDIAKDVGYTDDKRFSKVFKESIGITPNTYRKQKM